MLVVWSLAHTFTVPATECEKVEWDSEQIRFNAFLGTLITPSRLCTAMSEIVIMLLYAFWHVYIRYVYSP
jgi:hypothetical protein